MKWPLAALILGAVAVAVAVAVAPATATASEPPPPPPPAWGPLAEVPGLALRRAPDRSFATAQTRAALQVAADVAMAYGGALQVGEVSGPIYGAPFPPHKSHRFGADADVAYALAEYPTPLGQPVAEGFVAILAALAPLLDKVFVSGARKSEIETLALAHGWALTPLSIAPGHETHAHLRFIKP